MTFRVAGTVSGSVYGIVNVNVPFQQDQTIALQDLLGMAGMPVGEQQVQQALGTAKTVCGRRDPRGQEPDWMRVTGRGYLDRIKCGGA